MRKKTISKLLIMVCVLSLYACTDETDSNSNGVDVFNNIKIDISDEIVDDDCKFLVNRFFSRFSNFEFKRIFKVKTPLWSPHYSDEENSNILKFIAFEDDEMKGDYILFGIDREYSDFLFLNHIIDLGILTVDSHLRYSINLSVLQKYDCFDINSRSEAPSKGVIYENKTFEHDSSFLYTVDSILTIGEKDAFLFQGQQFHVEKNKFLISNSIKTEYLFKDYHLYFINNTDTLKTKMISRSKTHVILQDELNSLYFLSKKKGDVSD